MEAIVLDLDGTLLTSKENISKKTKDILYKFMEKGVKIIIATGRTYTSLKPYKDMLGLETPVVCFNGAKLVDRKEEIIFELPIEEELAKKCIEIAKDMEIHINFYQNEVWYVEEPTKEAQFYKNSSGLDYEIKKIKDFDNYEMTKLLFISENERLLELNRKLEEAVGKSVNKAFSKKYYLELMNKEVNKGETLLKLFDIEGINKENVVAFGDGWNDLEMLQMVGEGVAMGNADEELKKIVGRSCDTNDNDGIAKYLEKYL
mgnify:CR=1 FL=1